MKRKDYIRPRITSVAFRVENGYFASDPNQNRVFDFPLFEDNGEGYFRNESFSRDGYDDNYNFFGE
jgi:hypothetical protein